jgi:hypothetical protein
MLPITGKITPENQAEAVAFIDGLVENSSVVRSPLEDQADTNLKLYLGNHWKGGDGLDSIRRITVNRIQNSIISQVAIQSEETPKVKFTPRESLEPPVYYVNTSLDAPPTPDLIMMLDALPPETKQDWTDPETQEQRPPRPLAPEEVQMIESAIDNAARLTLVTGQETTIPADVLVGITDRVAAEALQTIFDAKWDECDGDFKIGENLLYSGIIGWQWTVCEWDDDKFVHVLRNVPFLQVHVDPLATGIKDAQYLIYDQVLSADEATALLPQLETTIREKAATGTIEPSGYAYRQASAYGNINFNQKMLTLRTAWIRNQPLPLSVAEAIERQIITTEELVEEKPVECTCGIGVTAPVSQHNEDCPCRNGYQMQPDALVTDPALEVLDVDAMEAPVEEIEQVGTESLDLSDAVPVDNQNDPGAALPPQSVSVTRTVYRHIKTGEEIEEGGRGWPSRPILRQLRIIADVVVDDRECEYVDIPVCLNVNIPIPFTPYGQGEPERLQGLQQAINSILTDMVSSWDANSQPAVCLPQSVNDMLPKLAQKMYTHLAGTKFVVPDELLLRLQGKLSFIIDPPNMPPDGWRLLELLLKLLDDSTNSSEVLQGKASASWSGEAIKSLQDAAKGSIGWKARRVEYMLKYMANVMAGSLVHRLPMAEKMRYVRRWPEHVWMALDEYQRKNLDYDLSVEITAGSGAKKQIQAVSDMGLYDRGLLSKQTILESASHDPKIEATQRMKEARQEASAQTQMPAGTPPPQAAQPQGQPQQAPPAEPQQQVA